MRLTDGLIVREISLVDRDVWVVKEPRSEQFFFFNDSEWSLLKSLPKRSITRDRSANPQYQEQVDQFYAIAATQGLIVGHSQSVTPTRDSLRSNWLSNPLAIRVPGFDPSEELDRILRYSNWFHLRFIWLLVGLAVLTVILHLDAFMSDVSRATYQLTVVSGSSWFLFLCALTIVKIVHEVAHGLVCQSLGGRCREMGVMFLFGVPCLYCDVSDAWLIRDRWSRIAVSAAGMMAEWIFASIATLVWASTHSGWVHDLAAMLVIVASISTVLVNANPLLRYDGYFMLSDWVGVPNLSAESDAALREVVVDREPWQPRIGLVLYAVASGLYRLIVIGLLLWVLASTVTGWIGVGAAFPVASWVGWKMTRRWFSLGTDLVARRTFAALGCGLLMFTVWMPLPQTIRIGGLVRAVGERNVYAPATGTMQSDNRSVRQDDRSLQMEVLQSRGLVDELTIGMRSLELIRFNQPEITASLPTWRQRLESANERLAHLSQQTNRLVLEWNLSETLFSPSRRETRRDANRPDRQGWTGLPLEQSNRHAVIERGTLLGRVGHRRRRVVSTFVPGEWIDRIRPGQTATVGMPSWEIGSLTGHVVNVSRNPVDELPPEVITTKWVMPDSMMGKGRPSQSAHYEVRIEVSGQEHRESPLPTRMVVPVRLHLSSQSIWGSLIDSLRATVIWAF